MPTRKSDATEGEARLPGSDASPEGPPRESGAGDEHPPALSTPDEAAEPGSPDLAEPPPAAADPEAAAEPYREPEIAAPESIEAPAEQPVAAAALSTRDEAAEPGAPELAGPPPGAADREAAAEPYREPEIVAPGAPEVVVAAAAPAPTAEAAEEAPEHEEEAGPSLASRLLVALLLLILGAGLALWGAPKLAPHLPSGMAGVAGWLTPGARDAEARIADLEARLGERVSAVEARLADTADIDARIAAAVDAAAGRLDGEIAALKEQVGRLGGTDLPQQLARLGSALDGQRAELAALKEQISGTEAARGQLSEEAAARIDVYRAELDGLRAEVGTLQERIAGLATQVEQAVAGAERQIDLARTQVEEIRAEADTRLSAAEADASLAAIRAAIASGAPFEAALATLEGGPGVTVPPGLAAAADEGVATLARLRDDFSDAAHAAIRASVMAGAGEGVVDRARAFLGAQVASRSLTPQEGTSPDAVLSRAEDRLRQDDLDGALAEIDRLPSEAQAAMGTWLADARQRAAAVDGLAELEAALSATH